MIKLRGRNVLILICLTFSIVALSACQSKAQAQVVDVLTQKTTASGKTQITVLVKYAFTINNFEKIIEEKFPDIDIVQVGNFTANTTLAKEYETRLEHDDLTDIVMTWPLEVGEDYWDSRLIDMAGMPFTNQYNISMLDTIAKDGKLYYLPGPAEIRGIVYNKTLFKENGWKVPNNYQEFISLCQDIHKTGMRSLQLSIGNSEVLNTAFVGYNYGGSYSKPKDTAWIYDYNESKKGNFKDHFGTALDNFQDLIDVGILQEDDLNLHYQDTQLNLFTRKTAMIEDSVLMTHTGKKVANCDDEFALMPFFNQNPNSDWVRIYMTCYVGLNKHLQDKGNEDKFEKVLDIINFISTPEGQTALSSDTGAMYSSLKNISQPNVKEIEALLPALSESRIAAFPTLKNAEQKLREGLAGMVKGTLTADEVCAMVDEQNRITNQKDESEIIGKANQDFTFIDTGNYLTDIMKEKCDSDIALFMDNGKDGLYNGKGISAKFYQGDITQTDLLRIFPDLKHGEVGELWKIQMKGKDLIRTLEYSIEVDGNNGWFYYFSGLKMKFDPIAKPGKRIKSITTSDGKDIDPNKLYTMTIMEDTVPEKYIESYEKTGVLIQDLLKESIQKDNLIQPAKDQRFTIYSE